jgi:hypothetical protein
VPSARAFRHGFTIALARALTTLACWWSGFRAISDDDYSRLVIAARFAQHPSADPSGTSWLPLPFWLYGVPMALFGDSLFVGRSVALVLGAASAVLVWQSGRLLGLGERAALWGGLGAVLLPYGAWLSAATVPEAPTAALLLFAAVTAARTEPRLRTFGGLAIGAACFSRYESWVPALVFAALCVADARRSRKRELWLAASFAAAPIALWLLHGVVRHGDAWFFVKRVSQYRAALGREPADVISGLATLWAIVRFEPELACLVAFTLGLAVARHESPFGPNAWRPLLVLSALVGFLIVAAISGGSATHHPERSLLPVFWFLALLAAGLVARQAESPRPWLLPVLAPPLMLAASLLLRPALRSTFVDRREEEQVGGVLRSLNARDVALDTDDFGFFAVQAALGYGKSWALSDHDPRRVSAPLPSNSAALRERLRQTPSRWLVSTAARAELARSLGRVRLTTPRLCLVELDP